MVLHNFESAGSGADEAVIMAVAGLLPQPRCNGLKAACYFIASAASSNLTGYYASRRVGILLTSTERSACQASWDACIRSQDSGLPPNNFAILTDT